MNHVQPIRDKEKVRDIIEFFAERNERNKVMFMFGIYTGLRISDILKIRVKQARLDYITLYEQKTKHTKRFPIVPKLRRELNKYIDGKKDNEYLFRSRQGKNKPITRVRAYEILREAARANDLKEIGTHTLRKTFGYHMYQMDKDVAMLQDIFNHSSEYITLKYIGINQDAIDKAMKQLTY